MKKEIFIEAYTKATNDNFEILSPFIEHDLTVLLDLKSIKFEIINCLMINQYQASITIINHLLERGLKLALIYNEVGIGSIPIEEWGTKFHKPNKDYGDKDLYNSIEICRNRDLITEAEEKNLKNNIREQFRNGFSHSDMNKILKEVPRTGSFFAGKFSDINAIQKIELPQTEIPFMQSIMQSEFAKQKCPFLF